MNKQYLGDGVFAAMDNSGAVILTTENGISVTNTIFLEPAVMRALQRYLDAAPEN